MYVSYSNTSDGLLPPCPSLPFGLVRTAPYRKPQLRSVGLQQDTRINKDHLHFMGSEMFLKQNKFPIGIVN